MIALDYGYGGLKKFKRELEQLIYFKHEIDQPTDPERFERIDELVKKMPMDTIREIYEKICGPLPKKKKLIPSDEEIRKSILDYAKNWPEKIREYASSLIEKSPKPPKEPTNTLS